MKPLGVGAVLCMAGWLAGQQSSQKITSYVFDGMGHRTQASRSTSTRTGSDTRIIERRQSVNGGEVPLDSVQERVVSDSGGVRIVERIVRRYDADGHPGPPEKTRIEERQEADGSTTTTTTL
ncbi:MAG: hypothetical protein M1541_03135 [Acidobacteria bacterium]|nr:hypothetical protein [Acidobacteriota bacterium]